MIGASVGIIIKNPSKKLIGNINAFAAGLMLSIVMFDLIPEAVTNINFLSSILLSFIGVLIIVIIDIISGNKEMFNTSHGKVAFMAAVGLMIHNFPEGIIMGAGFLASGSLGIKMSLLIAIHDIPEGIAVSAPLMAAKIRSYKIMIYAFITALPTVIGGWIGAYIGNISSNLLGACLSITSGIMLYVIFGEMLPEALELWKGRSITFNIFFGIILGLVITNLL
ncbi:ZIP family metal transporter [Clostridium ganghwense]